MLVVIVLQDMRWWVLNLMKGGSAVYLLEEWWLMIEVYF